MDSSDRDYLIGRAERERRLAAEAASEVARDVHLRLAHEYDVRANVSRVAARADNDLIAATSDGGRRS
jgi:hypothetical protein